MQLISARNKQRARSASCRTRMRQAFVPMSTGQSLIEEELPMSTGQSLIGEELVTDDASASNLADRCITEAQRLFQSSTGWREKLVEDGVVVEVCPVEGPYAPSGVDLVRGVGELSCSAADFFDFQTSKLGFEATDEYLQNHRNVAVYRWAGHPVSETEPPNLMVNRVEWPYPFKTREFVSLDLFDHDTGIFVSKSILHAKRPGGSKYQERMLLDEREFVRAVQYYAAVAEPISSSRCRLKMVTWGEMCDNYTAFWVNEFNARLFIVPKFKRFNTCLSMSGEERDVEAYLAKECSRNISTVAWQLLQKVPSLKAEILRAPSDAMSDFLQVFKSKNRGCGKHLDLKLCEAGADEPPIQYAHLQMALLSNMFG